MRTALPAAFVALLVLLPLAIAADPTPVSWGGYNAISTVNAVGLAAEGTTIGAALAPPPTPSTSTVTGGARVVTTDLAILDLGVGFTQNGTGTAQPPEGRTHVAVSRDGTAVASLGIDVRPRADTGIDPNNPTVPDDPTATPDASRQLRLAYDRAPANGNFSSGPSTNATAFLEGVPVALVISDDGLRMGVATQETGFLNLWTFHASGTTLSPGIRYRTAGNVTGLAVDGAFSRLYASADLPQGSTTRGVLLVLPTNRADPSASHADLTTENSSARSVAASRDGNVVAMGTAGGRLLVFDATGGVLSEPRVLTFAGAPEPVLKVLVSEDGQRVAALAGRNLTHADVTGGGLRALWTASTATAPTSLAYNRTGGILVATVPGEGVIAFGDATADVLWKNTGAASSVSINAAGDTVAFARNTVVVALRIPRGLTLEHLGAGDLGPLKPVRPGASVTYDLAIRNTGAAPESVVLEGPSDPTLRLYLEPAIAYVKPGETKTVTLTVEADPTFAGGRTFNLTARALTSSVRDETTIRLGLQTEAIVSMLLNETDLTVRPGEPTTLLVGIQNNGTRDAAVGIRARQQVSSGAPWDVSIDPSSLTLAPKSRTTVRVVVTPPADVANGTSSVLSLTLEGPEVGDTATVILRVNPSVGVEVNAVGRVRFIPPGQAGEYNVTVKNTGSIGRTFEAYYDLLPVDGAAPRAWSVDMSTSEFLLEPGATRTIKVRILAPFDVTPADRVSVRVTARLIPLNDTEPPLLGNVTLFANGEDPVPTPIQDGNGSTIPGPAPLVLAAAIVLVALLRRRRA